MKITSIRLKKLNNSGCTIGVASIELDNCLVIHDIKLVDLYDGRRVISFPNKRVKKYVGENGNYTENFEYTDIVHPANSEFRKYIETELFKIYDSEEVVNE